MNRSPNIYLKYKITNKFIRRVIDEDYNGKWKLRLNPTRFISNRTNYDYWKNNIEKVELQCNSTFTFEELESIRIKVISNLNYILQCIELDKNKETIKLDIVINNTMLER